MNWASIEPWPSRDFVWPPFTEERNRVTDLEIQDIRRAGFDFIRLTIDPGIFIWAEGAGRTSQLHEILTKQITRYSSAGLKVIVDPHPVDQHEEYTAAAFVSGLSTTAFAAYAAMIGRLAKLLGPLASEVALELMNEPPVDTGIWANFASRLHAIARSSAGERLTLVIPGGRFGAPEGLTALNSAAFVGSNVIFTFHDYVPFTFTHQGVQGTKNAYIRGVPWPPSKLRPGALDGAIRASLAAAPEVARADKPAAFATAKSIADSYLASSSGPQETRTIFDRVTKWASDGNIPPQRVLLGEFGVARSVEGSIHAPEADRVAWLSEMRRDAEAHGFAWAVWAYRGPGGMAITNEGDRVALDPATLTALGLNKSK